MTKELQKVLTCLYIAVDSNVADDVNKVVREEVQLLQDKVDKWQEIAKVLYEGYKGMISGKPWTDESVKIVDEAIRQYEQVNRI